jgi:hypothetical protein
MKHLRLFQIFTLLLAFFSTAGNASGQVVISQVYGGGGNSGATYTHDFIELFNRGTTNIDLTGWSVQYASTTGTSWQVTILSSTTLLPGQYYLIQQAQGSGGTTPLPTPDVIGTIPMAGTNGKVALVSSTTALSGACPLPNVLDFVGYGSANCFEGTGATPVLSNTTAAIRLNGGCTDTDDNAADFVTGAPTPRNTASPFNNCGVSIVETPTFNPPGGVYSSAQNVVIATTTPGAQIYYTTDGTDPDETSTLYMGPVNISGNTTTLKAKAYATGFNPSPVATAVYYIPVNVSNISTLRAGTLGSAYKLTGQAVLTFQQAFRNQKYIQDATAAILIDDLPGVITSMYNVNDGITGITGVLNVFGNMMQFTPLADPGNATSSGNVITPQVITLAQLNTNFMDYQAELVKVMNVSFADAGGTFANGQVYTITDGSKAIFGFRTTFFDVDYIGQIIPNNANITVLPNSRIDGDFVTSRSLADIQPLSNPPTKLVITSVNNGANPYTNVDFSVTVQTQDALGNPAFPASNINFTFTTNGGTGGTASFSPGSATTGTVLSGTSQVVVTGVNMSPAGTNVTITASDNNPFGLQSGTSTPFNVVDFVIPNIIICEIMQDPFAVGDNAGEWFEVYNASNTPVDMNGWIIKDDGTNMHIISGSLIVPPLGFAVLGNDANSLTNGGYTCNYQYPTSFALGNTDDEIVLLLPDGITEVDRVNYTGIDPWVDPTGASMIFAGLPTDDNNDGTKWIVSTLREPSYNGTEGDLGSPGSLGNGQFTGITGFDLNLKVFLEGAFNTATNLMATDLLTSNLIPLEQPFNPPLPYYGNNTPKWFYNGPGTASSLPADAVDWVLVELRDALSAESATSATSIAKEPGLLLSDGTVVSPNGVSLLGFNVVINDFLFVVVWSRNHLGIMSSSGFINPSGMVSYDFTTGAGQVYGTNGSKELSTGLWGMFSGDVNADGTINDADKTPAGWNTEAGETGYFGSDMNMNSTTDNVDKNDLWLPNYLKSTQVPN